MIINFKDMSTDHIKVIGFISNHEYIFFTDIAKKKWWFETSLDVWQSMDVLQKGDPALFHINGEYTEAMQVEDKEAIDIKIAQVIVTRIARKLCEGDFDPKKISIGSNKASEPS